MRILVTGSSGLIGAGCVARRRAAGDQVVALVRREPGVDEIQWDPPSGKLDPAAVDGFDAVVHLAGESIHGRWTAAKKDALMQSRVRGTGLLCQSLARVPRPPGVFVSASGINAYGDRGDELLDETCSRGVGFMPDICRAWEAATAQLDGVSRIAHLRIGFVLDREGGALPRMLGIYRLGLGGVIAGGRSWVSWITLQDTLAAIDHVIATRALQGPVNIVAPNPATNRQFVKALGRALRRPTITPVPAWALRLVYGEMARETILTSQRAVPRRLVETGFRFQHEHIEDAMRSVLTIHRTTPPAGDRRDT
jgi:uncharacterized protein (TIGR01777 family)